MSSAYLINTDHKIFRKNVFVIYVYSVPISPADLHTIQLSLLSYPT